MRLERIADASDEGGAGLAIWAIEGLRDELDEYEGDDEDAIVSMFGWVAEHGLPTVKSKCNSLGDQLFELKCGRVRLTFIWYPGLRRNILILTHFGKDSPKTPPREIRRAKRMKGRVDEALKGGTIVHEK